MWAWRDRNPHSNYPPHGWCAARYNECCATCSFGGHREIPAASGQRDFARLAPEGKADSRGHAPTDFRRRSRGSPRPTAISAADTRCKKVGKTRPTRPTRPTTGAWAGDLDALDATGRCFSALSMGALLLDRYIVAYTRLGYDLNRAESSKGSGESGTERAATGTRSADMKSAASQVRWPGWVSGKGIMCLGATRVEE